MQRVNLTRAQAEKLGLVTTKNAIELYEVHLASQGPYQELAALTAEIADLREQVEAAKSLRAERDAMAIELSLVKAELEKHRAESKAKEDKPKEEKRGK